MLPGVALPYAQPQCEPKGPPVRHHLAASVEPIRDRDVPDGGFVAEMGVVEARLIFGRTAAHSEVIRKVSVRYRIGSDDQERIGPSCKPRNIWNFSIAIRSGGS